jgi:hypothetical protein
MSDVPLIRQLGCFDLQEIVTCQREQIYIHFMFVLLLQGDSGGPLTTIHYPRRLVGIVSWGPQECGDADYPAVYTKVSVVRKWILKHCGL